MTASGVEPCLKLRDRRQRNHGLLTGGDRSTGRGRAVAGQADRVGGGIARGLRVGGGGRNAGSNHGSRDGVGSLRAGDRSARRADIDVLERLRILPEPRRHFHDHVILVAGDIDRRHLALAECVIERVVDLADGDPELGRGITVDHEVGFQPLVLLVAVDVGEQGLVLQRGRDLRRPFVELLQRGALQRVLILRVAGAAADANVLHGLQEQRRSGYHRHGTPQPRDDAVGGDVAFRQRQQRDEHETGIGLAAAGEPDRGFDRRILLDGGDELRQLLLHQLKGNTLVGLDRADQSSGVLLREEALRNDDVQIDAKAHRNEENQHHHGRMPSADVSVRR